LGGKDGKSVQITMRGAKGFFTSLRIQNENDAGCKVGGKSFLGNRKEMSFRGGVGMRGRGRGGTRHQRA